MSELRDMYNNEFFGFHVHKLDDLDSENPKNRIVVPKNFRNVIKERNQQNLDTLISQAKLLYDRQYAYYKGLLVHTSDVPGGYTKRNPLRLKDNVSPTDELNSLLYFCKIRGEEDIRVYASLDWMRIEDKSKFDHLLKRMMKNEGRVVITPILKRLEISSKEFVEISGKGDYFSMNFV